MKKIKQIPALLAILMLLLSGSLLFQSCKEEDLPIPNPKEKVEEKEKEEKEEEEIKPPITYHFKVFINDEEGGLVDPTFVTDLLKDSFVMVTIKPDSAYTLYSVKVNDLPLPDFEPTTQEFSFVIDSIKEHQKVEVEFIETDVLIISVSSIEDPAWYLRAIKRFKEDGTYLHQIVFEGEDDPMLTDRYYYLFPSMEGFRITAEGVVWGKGQKWSLKNRIMRSYRVNPYIQHSGYCEITELTPTKLVFRLMPLSYHPDRDYYYYDEYTFVREF